MTNIKDIAQYTGVSASTVSRALSNTRHVKETTRKKIVDAARHLNYSPNILAQGLKTGRSNTIALMIPSIQNMIFPGITRGVEDTAHKKGFAVILCNTDENIEIEKTYIEALRLRLIDGFIFATMMPQSTHIRRLREEQVPTVLALRACDKSIDAVIIDNTQAAYNGTKYLIERGHKKIALALGNTELALYSERFRGYRQALEDSGIVFDEALVMHERSGVNSFYTLTKMMIEKGNIPDAVFATNDARAIVSMRALYDLGFKIPGDVSVLGFDNVEIAAYMEPPLSTISQPLYNMGVLAAEKLICQIQYKEKNGVLEEPMIDTVEADIVIRKSTR